MNELKFQELECINGGGYWANVINATVGTIAVGNCIVVGVTLGPVWGAVAILGGAYCIYNACT